MYGGNSARSNLSKILGNTPPIHKKAVIPISPTNNSEIRTTSSILLGHISTKVHKYIYYTLYFTQIYLILNIWIGYINVFTLG